MRNQGLILLTLCLLLFQCAPQKEEISFQYSEALSSGEKLFKVSIDELKKKEGHLPLFIDSQGNTLVSQPLFEDGKVAELLVMGNLKGANAEKVEVRWVAENSYPKFPSRTDIRIGYSENKDKKFVDIQSHVRPEGHIQGNYIYQAEGPIWENEMVAFRSYFDPRNGKDIFGKTKHQLCSDEIGVSGNYHELQDWGMDILKVGSSLGAGALAIKKADSLYRLGDTERAEAKIITNDAPLMSQLLFDYDGWKVEDKVYNVEEQINIYAGQRWYESVTTIEGSSATDTLVTGIVNLHDLSASSFEYKGYQVYYTHGVQSFLNEILGMAVIVADENFAGFDAAPTSGDGITNTYTAYLKATDGKYKYQFFVGWEKENPEFREEAYFVEQVKAAIESIGLKAKLKEGVLTIE